MSVKKWPIHCEVCGLEKNLPIQESDFTFLQKSPSKNKDEKKGSLVPKSDLLVPKFSINRYDFQFETFEFRSKPKIHNEVEFAVMSRRPKCKLKNSKLHPNYLLIVTFW